MDELFLYFQSFNFNCGQHHNETIPKVMYAVSNFIE